MSARHSTAGLQSNASGSPLVEPDAVCESCGALGTVGKVFIAAHDNVAERTYRYCLNCWPIESAAHRARIKERLRRLMEPQFFTNEHHANDAGVDTSADTTATDERHESYGGSAEQREFRAFSRVGATRVARFESATWHHVEETVEKLQELLQMVQSGTVPTVEELEESAREIAAEIIAEADTRVGRMPLSIVSFLQDFGPDGDFGTPAPKLTPAESRAAINDAVAAAHASADEAIAAFDQQLETLTIPTTETERAAVETELVEMLEQLRAEIDVERSAQEAFETQIKAAMSSGNHYGVKKLARDAEERVMRLHGLMGTVEDLEALHTRLLQAAPPMADASANENPQPSHGTPPSAG